jgi:hypothetical protein
MRFPAIAIATVICIAGRADAVTGVAATLGGKIMLRALIGYLDGAVAEIGANQLKPSTQNLNGF